jgi:hypothetical protein
LEPVERCIVTVLAGPDFEALPLLLLPLLLPASPVMWKGKEYWKHVVSVSLMIVKP